MPHKITVTRLDPPAVAEAGKPLPFTETEVFSQTVENFDLPKFVVALNKQKRVRKSKT